MKMIQWFDDSLQQFCRKILDTAILNKSVRRDYDMRKMIEICVSQQSQGKIYSWYSNALTLEKTLKNTYHFEEHCIQTQVLKPNPSCISSSMQKGGDSYQSNWTCVCFCSYRWLGITLQLIFNIWWGFSWVKVHPTEKFKIGSGEVENLINRGQQETAN